MLGRRLKAIQRPEFHRIGKVSNTNVMKKVGVKKNFWKILSEEKRRRKHIGNILKASNNGIPKCYKEEFTGKDQVVEKDIRRWKKKHQGVK